MQAPPASRSLLPSPAGISISRGSMCQSDRQLSSSRWRPPGSRPALGTPRRTVLSSSRPRLAAPSHLLRRRRSAPTHRRISPSSHHQSEPSGLIANQVLRIVSYLIELGELRLGLFGSDDVPL